MRIVVLGYIVRGPYGGLVWHHLQYVLGLRDLGHEVLFVEDSDDYPSCSVPTNPELICDPSYGLRFIAATWHEFELGSNWAYYDAQTGDWYGLSGKYVYDFCHSADIVLNLSGVNPLRNWWAKIPVRVFIDTDPAFTQIKHLTDPARRSLAQAHNAFFSFGENIGKTNCSIPDDGFAWKPTRQPVFLQSWCSTAGDSQKQWTTVMQWDSYQPGEYMNRQFGMKSASFEEYLTLPEKLGACFELAIGSSSAPKEKLLRHNWRVSSAVTMTANHKTYQRFIQQSKGEWSVAKHGYVASNSGWFSERSTGYLASGRPVVVQDTGFSTFLPAGTGLLSFSTLDEAVEALQTVNRQYKQHCKAAREIAETFFDSKKVLQSLLERL
jgi:hypothetical protein